MRNLIIGAVMALVLGSKIAVAGACNYKPSNLLGSGGTVAAATVGGVAIGAKGAAKAASLYTLKNFVTGAYMLGSTAGGASAAGTVGIMGGTAGLSAAALAVILKPVTLIVVGGASAFEGVCYLSGK